MYKSMGLKQIRKNFPPKWEGVYGTGDFDNLFDYNAGLLKVFVSVSPESTKLDKWVVMFGISTIDDGVWQAFNIAMSKDDAFKKATDVAEGFIKFQDRSKVLPTEKELNDFLMSYGLWGEYTG